MAETTSGTNFAIKSSVFLKLNIFFKDNQIAKSRRNAWLLVTCLKIKVNGTLTWQRFKSRISLLVCRCSKKQKSKLTFKLLPIKTANGNFISQNF